MAKFLDVVEAERLLIAGVCVIKVALIGAGSVVFSKNLTADILSFPEFRSATLACMDCDRERLQVAAALCEKSARALGASPIIGATTDRREALSGADFVINMAQIGGFDATLIDFEIPRKYGLNFTIGDTTGPGGLFRGLRTFPFLRDLCREMMEVCPRALLINYANPMSMNMQTIARTSDLRAIGLCHSVQGTVGQIAHYLKLQASDITFTCAGINHMAFYLRLEKDGHDFYPRLFAAMNDPMVYNADKVRFEIMKRLGYFVTESSEHNAEYNPWFIPHGREVIARYSIPIDEYLRRCDGLLEEFDRLKAQSRCADPMDVQRSAEYGSLVIHSVASGASRVVYGNMPNEGAIGNLNPETIVEAPTIVDRLGPRFVRVGDLPPQLLGYIQPHVMQHDLFVRAALEGDRDAIYQACMVDPLTAAILSADRIVEMCDELIASHGPALPRLDAKKMLSHVSGSDFSPVSANVLRKRRHEAKIRSLKEYIVQWDVIGPFPSTAMGRVSLDQSTPLEEALLSRADATPDLQSPCEVGHGHLYWKSARADASGRIDLDLYLGRHEWAIAYGYAKVKSSRERETILRCGSDDGIQIWLNGQMVHRHEIGRAYSTDADSVSIRLRQGINHLLVKIDNYQGGWAFGVAIADEAA